MSAIADLIAAARGESPFLRELADAAEKELADVVAGTERLVAAGAELQARLAVCRKERDEMVRTLDHLTLGALRKASEFIASFVRASDAMAHEWKQGDWRAVLKLVRDLTEDARSLLAQLEKETANGV